jgi:glycosyltransferase involved in cell wall biosynthesis
MANDWTADPTSKHHIMSRLSRTNDVLWVEASGMRAPKLTSAYDRRRILTKAKSMFRQSRQVADHIHVLSPPTLPYPHSRLAQIANGGLYSFSVRRELRRLGLDRRPILCVFVPQVAPYVRRLHRQFTIYYCVDRWSKFKDFDPETMDRAEEEMCRTADIVFASAEDLADRCSRWSGNVHYVPHGVDYEHFARALEPGPLPDDLASIPEPRIGFFGLLHEWVDTELIGRLADAHPRFSFVLIGAASGDLSDLTRRTNVHHLGRRPFAQLPDYCRGFAAALVPFRLNELTTSVNPIKLREYAASGMPVVSSDLPEVRRLPEIATVARSFDEWVAAVETAVHQGSDPALRRRQSEKVRGDDWSARCARLARLVNETGIRRPGRTAAPAVALAGGR